MAHFNVFVYLSVQSKGEFDWSQKDLQILIQAYFYGYTASHFPGGILGDFFGAKVVLNSGFLVSGICSLLTPVSARYGGFWVLFFIRIVMGLGHVSIYALVFIYLTYTS